MDIFIDLSTISDVSLLFLMACYGFILFQGSNLISDGSELLLLIPQLAGIVGSIILPVLGAVPDGALILFSGLSGDPEVVAVGVGALAGSTIMLLTIPWGLCILMGRVDLDSQGNANYSKKPKLTRGYNVLTTGINPRKSITINGVIMVMTCLPYLIIQGAAFAFDCYDENQVQPGNTDCQTTKEFGFELAALIYCVLAFIAYMLYNAKTAQSEDKKDFVAEVRKQAIDSHIISLSAAFSTLLKEATDSMRETSALHASSDADKQFKQTLKSFFARYDKNGDGVIDPSELRSLLKDLGEDVGDDKFKDLMKEMDTDNSGAIDFDEFSVAMKRFVQQGSVASSFQGHDSDHLVTKGEHSVNEEGEDGEDDEEEEEEVPDDLAHLTPKMQKIRILWRSAWMMGLGTLLVLVFSDPMSEALSELATRIHVPSFYVAFVLAPLASNASELIASISYAKKKTQKTITISLAALEGAACMNNTFCLAIFLILICIQKSTLGWEYSAETISILFVEAAVFLFTLHRKPRAFEAFLILSLYPISLVLVFTLEAIGLD